MDQVMPGLNPFSEKHLRATPYPRVIVIEDLIEPP